MKTFTDVIGERELPDMGSASEEGRGSWKGGCSKGACVNASV